MGRFVAMAFVEVVAAVVVVVDPPKVVAPTNAGADVLGAPLVALEALAALALLAPRALSNLALSTT
jgi:hypothetical protein